MGGTHSLLMMEAFLASQNPSQDPLSLRQPPGSAHRLQAKRPHSPGDSQLSQPCPPTPRLALRFVAKLLKAILDPLTFYFNVGFPERFFSKASSP